MIKRVFHVCLILFTTLILLCAFTPAAEATNDIVSIGRFYVNSWSIENNNPLSVPPGEKFPGGLLCGTMQNPITEAIEIFDSKTNALEYFYFIITAFGKSIRPRKADSV